MKLTIYAGGVAGDEKDVIRKIQIGQLHAAGFTGVGLGTIYPAVRIFELPLFFKNYDEVDYVTGKLQKKMEDGFASKGYVLLGWAEAGFVNIFSNTPIRSQKDMQGVKMWEWAGDPLVKAMYDGFKIVPVPLSLVDVLTALSTNMISAVYAPPLGAIAMQWHGKTKYVTEVNLADSTGALLMSKKEFDKLAPADQKILKDTAREFSKKLVAATRADNARSTVALKKQGLQFVTIDPAELASLTKISEGVWDKLAGQLYPAELLAEAKSYLAEYRTRK
jgi:TRAP-type C4-dicarboxylate transport system substrate-binding protein